MVCNLPSVFWMVNVSVRFLTYPFAVLSLKVQICCVADSLSLVIFFKVNLIMPNEKAKKEGEWWILQVCSFGLAAFKNKGHCVGCNLQREMFFWKDNILLGEGLDGSELKGLSWFLRVAKLFLRTVTTQSVGINWACLGVLVSICEYSFCPKNESRRDF